VSLSPAPIRVLLVDDSAVVRGFIGRILEKDADIQVVGSAANGEAGVTTAAGTKPDIILLDVEMPVMDGLTAIPHLLEKSPQSKIIMCSTLTTGNGATTLKALTLGAVDCIAKPTALQDIYAQDSFRDQLLHKIKSIMGTRPMMNTAPTAASPKPTLHPHLPRQVILRDAKTVYQGKPQIVAIGSSTGGPNALMTVLKHCAGFDIPIVVTQHMPPTFTKILAEHIATATGLEAVEASEGLELKNGVVHVAQGGFHMRITQNTMGKKIITLDDGPMENFCKPAVDPMLRSLMPLYDEKILTVILTGMGQDGLKAARELAARGTYIIAQDEATSVVWGMPGAVALDGLCCAVLPLDHIGPAIRKRVLQQG
jgi:two-component system, chemotaxis family, protein-glutamate methylesterase/glutaminase